MTWLINSGLTEDDLNDAQVMITTIEAKVKESTNPLIQQVELTQIIQTPHETGEHLCNRLREKANRCAFETVTNYHDHQLMLALLRAVSPNIRKKMLLKKVSTFDEASAILLAEEQAANDTKQCTSNKSQEEAEANAMSSYRKTQRYERQNFTPPDTRSDQKQTNNNPKAINPNETKCRRCNETGHWSSNCKAWDQNCGACGRIGHYAVACRAKSWNSQPTPAQANSVKAYLSTQSENERHIYVAQQIEKAKACGLTYNIQAGECHNADKMTPDQKEFMACGNLEGPL